MTGSVYHSIVQSGNQAFASWLGRPDLAADLEQQMTLKDRLKNQCAQIAGKLLLPPDENTRTPVEVWIKTPVDQAYRELAADLNLEPCPFWPNGAPYAVCLTHDVDRIADEVRRQGGLLVINWHQHFCNRDTCPMMFNWVEKIITRAHTDKAWIALPRDVALHWRERTGKRGIR